MIPVKFLLFYRRTGEYFNICERIISNREILWSKLNKNFNQRFVYLFSPSFQFHKNHRYLILHFKYHFRLTSLLYILRYSDCYAIPKKHAYLTDLKKKKKMLTFLSQKTYSYYLITKISTKILRFCRSHNNAWTVWLDRQIVQPHPQITRILPINRRIMPRDARVACVGASIFVLT